MSVAESSTRAGGAASSGVSGDSLGAHELDGVVDLVVAGLGALPVSDAVARCQRYRGLLDAVEAVKLAEVVGANGDSRAASRAAGRGGKVSKQQARRRGKRAAAVAKNKTLADKMASGDMSGEQVDAIAHAAAKSGGAAAVDDELINAVSNVGPDQGRKLVDDWLAERANADGTQTEHDRQRRLRRASRYTNKDGMGVINVEGDQVTIDAIWAEVMAEANRLYVSDGGRDIATRLHKRTNSQRLFDALAALTAGAVTSPGAKADRPSVSERARRVPTVVAVVDIDKLTGVDPAVPAHQIGVGPIADTVLAGYLQHGNLVGALFSGKGQPLWLGRLARHASLGQRLALAVRDKGCVLCGADWRTCHAHHLTPWNAPAKGQTNIDELALVCGDCHRRLHDDNQTLYQQAYTRLWKLRPATLSETPQPAAKPFGSRRNARHEPPQRI